MSTKTKKNKKLNSENPLNPVLRSPTDYGDDFGVYRPDEKQRKNIATFLYFPFLLIVLEVATRVAVGETLLTFNLAYVILFSISVGIFITLICTFASEKINRHIGRSIAFLITLWYCYQIIYFNTYKTFFSLNASNKGLTLDNITKTIVEQKIPLIIAIVPLLLFLVTGSHLFPFMKVKPSKKLLSLVFVIILQLSLMGFIYGSNIFMKNNDYYVYYFEKHSTNIQQEKFGIATMEELDITQLIKNNCIK